MFQNNINPVAFSLFGLEVRYYGIVYALALLSLYFYLIYITKKKEIVNFKTSDVENFSIGLAISVIVGARAFEVLFYGFNYYTSNPAEIFAIWHGGLSFHGGLVFGILWVILFAKIKRISFFRITDALVLPVVLFLSIGRLANFANGELKGIATNVTIGVIYAGENFARWPTQILESIKNLFIFGLVYFLSSFKEKIFRKYVPGLITAIALVSYGVLRFLIEFLKDSPSILFSLNIGQLFSLVMIVGGMALFKILLKKR